MTQIKDCPHCGFENGLETFLRIDLDDVVIENGEMVSFTLAGSANDPSNGVVIEEAEISCRNCGKQVEGAIPGSVMGRWIYSEVPPRVLVIRDPDYENEYVTEGAQPETIDIDLGRSFNGPKDFDADTDWGRDFIQELRLEVEDLDPDGPIRRRVEELIADLKGYR